MTPNLNAVLAPNIHTASLNTPYPQGQNTVDNEIGDDGVECVVLGLFETELVIVVEGHTGNEAGAES